MGNQRKTLRDYVLEGGIKGMFFHGAFDYLERCKDCPSSLEREYKGIYEVLNCTERIVTFKWVGGSTNMPCLEIVVRGIEGNNIGAVNSIGYHLSDKEATPEEVQRAKEGQLAQKVRENMIPMGGGDDDIKVEQPDNYDNL